jgi:hypothetical protein
MKVPDVAFIVFVAAIVCIVIYIVARDSTWFRRLYEGFSAGPVLESPTCPPGYTFFNDAAGESFCCRGRVNPYTHQCEAPTGHTEMDYKQYKHQDHGGDDIACYFDGRSASFCKNACDSDPNCKAYNDIHRGGRQEGCCYKRVGGPIRPFPGGGVDFYLKQGPNVVSDNTLCAFEPNTPDPRQPNRTLPVCSSLIRTLHQNHQSRCPPTLPNYAMVGKCCAHNPDTNGFDCIPTDNANTALYCKVVGPLNPGEHLCSEVAVLDAASCPNQLPQKVNYVTGQKEAAVYGATAAGVEIPVCYGLNDQCIPDNVIGYNQEANGLFKGKDIKNWAYACSAWTNKHVNMDTTAQQDTSYP